MRNKKFIGYSLKTNNYNYIPEFENLGSVSHCIRKEPARLENIWNYNECGLFDTIEKAKLNTSEKHFTIFAYYIYNFAFCEGELLHSSEFLTKAEKVNDCDFNKRQFDFIGYDIVSNDLTTFVECSPLSCNYAHKDFKTNKFCLIDLYEYSLEVCKAISKGNYEPGIYYLFEVWQLKKNTSLNF